MATAWRDYERFIRWLHEPDRRVSEDARRFANLALANFHTVAETSRQRNQRSEGLDIRIFDVFLEFGLREGAVSSLVRSVAVEGSYPVIFLVPRKFATELQSKIAS
ncbi:hypothetical protein BGLT_02804 [Caballeronia glathei]|nr:hypothetical protein BGLT_02804 [Caballeronia glathei]